jgi:hypothetical protein
MIKASYLGDCHLIQPQLSDQGAAETGGKRLRKASNEKRRDRREEMHSNAVRRDGEVGRTKSDAGREEGWNGRGWENMRLSELLAVFATRKLLGDGVKYYYLTITTDHHPSYVAC